MSTIDRTQTIQAQTIETLGATSMIDSASISSASISSASVSMVPASDRLLTVLREQQQRMPLKDDSSDLVAICDFNGFLRYLNPAGRAILGVEPEENLSLFQIRCFTPLKQSSWDEIFTTLMANGIWSGEDVLQYHREPIQARLIVMAHGIDSGEIDCFSIVGRIQNAVPINIQTEHIQCDIQLGEKQFRSLVETLNDVFYCMDLEGNFTYISPQIETLVGYRVEEFLGRNCLEMTHPEDHERTLSEIQNLFATGISGQPELRVEHKAGHFVWIAVNNSLLRSDYGDIIGMQGSLRNIEDRKAAEAALKDREEQLQHITANAPGAIYRYLIEANGREAFTYLNEGWRELFEIDPQLALQDSAVAWQRIYSEDLPRLQQEFQTISQGTSIKTFEFRLQMPSGELKWVQAQSRSTQQADATILDGFMIDVTARKLAEDALTKKTEELKRALKDLKLAQARMVQAEKMSALGQLVAGVAHEINNPVNFIYGNLKYSQDYIQDLMRLIEQYRQHYPSPVAEIAETIAEIDLDYLLQDLPKMHVSMKVGADRIREIVLSLRNFSRLDEAEYKEADLNQGIDSTLMILQNRIKANDRRPDIQITKHYGDVSKVACFAGQMNQVYMNLLANAIDALEDAFESGKVTEPEIQIETLIENDQAVLRFSDNGPGIPAPIKARLFDPFFTTKPIGQGTGMGLSISYQIVAEKHNGQLICLSEIGKGTTFELRIPLTQGISD